MLTTENIVDTWKRATCRRVTFRPDGSRCYVGRLGTDATVILEYVPASCGSLILANAKALNDPLHGYLSE